MNLELHATLQPFRLDDQCDRVLLRAVGKKVV